MCMIATYFIKLLPSAVSPDMAMPMWSSILCSFFWKEASSLGDRFRPASTTCVLLRSPRQAVPCVCVYVCVGNRINSQLSVALCETSL
jgi:hypothetical protein